MLDLFNKLTDCQCSISRVIAIGMLGRHLIIKQFLQFCVEPVYRCDESVIGTAILGGVMSGTVCGFLLLDITPSNINLASADQVTEKVLKLIQT